MSIFNYIKIIFLNFLIKHVVFSYFLFFLISFFESLFLLGLFMPSSFLIFFTGFLVGKKYLNFYILFFLGIFGCTLGDILSYHLGKNSKEHLHVFKKRLFRYSSTFENIFSFFKKNTFLFFIFGKFISFFRSFMFFLSGMLSIPIHKILLPNFISTCLWSIIYLLPGVMSGVSISIPNSLSFNIYLFTCIFLVFFNMFMFYQWFMFNNFDLYYISLDKKVFMFYFILSISILFYFLLNLIGNPVFNMFFSLFYKLLLNK